MFNLAHAFNGIPRPVPDSHGVLIRNEIVLVHFRNEYTKILVVFKADCICETKKAWNKWLCLYILCLFCGQTQYYNSGSAPEKFIFLKSSVFLERSVFPNSSVFVKCSVFFKGPVFLKSCLPQMFWSLKVQTYKRFKGTLLIRTRQNKKSFGVIPFVKLENNT